MTSHLRTALVRELGISAVWRLRSSPVPVASTALPVNEPGAGHNQPGMIAVPQEKSSELSRSSVASAAMPVTPIQRDSSRHEEAGQQPKPVSHFIPPVQPAVAENNLQPAGSRQKNTHIASMDWDALEAAIKACSACRLHANRRQAVPGVGDRAASWLFVGEGPGAEEDRKGEPFVGPAGKLLDKMLTSIGLARGSDVYIANAVKCRPPSNRTPTSDEIADCGSYLDRQIALIQPSLIVALGRPAALALLGEDVKINQVRGRLFHRDGIPVIVTYHPSYLLRNPAEKAKAWQDLCFAKRQMQSLKP